MKLVYKGHASLNAKSNDVTSGKDVSSTVDEMFRVMYEGSGIGLAANQVGILDRIIVMHAGGLKQEFINPVITKEYGGKVTAKEGCLSFPGKLATMTRNKQVVIEGFDRDWKPIKRKLKGIAARCAQHEVDHLNGITIERG